MASLDDASDGGPTLGAVASLDLGPDALSYKSCTMTQDEDQRWRATYAYRLQGQEHLAHVIVPGGAMNDECRRVLEHAGLVLLCGPWTLKPCRRILCEAMPLSDAQKSFWIQFYREAFAEFALENKLSKDACDVSVEAATIDEEEAPVETSPDNVRLLCGLSGGRGSLVAWALCRRQPRVAEVDWLYVGNAFAHSKRLRGVVERTGGSIRIAEVSGLAAGGPRAARCAFQGIAVASLLGYDGFVVGHARSAGEGNGVVYGGREVNHQFDQSLKWEEKIRKYLRHLSTVAYVSPLQHLWALQVTGIFCREKELKPFYALFRSCDELSDGWCAACPKCASVFCLVSAFRDDASTLFHGVDLYEETDMVPFFEELVGKEKALAGVGTARETKLALALARRRRKGWVGEVLAAHTDGNVPSARLLTDRGPSWSPAWWDAGVLEALESVKQLEALRKAIVQERGRGTFVNRLFSTMTNVPREPMASEV